MMKSFLKWLNEWKRDEHTKTITVVCRDLDDTLEELLKYIKSVGNTGHTFNIVVDPDAKGGKKFEWDGDGSDAIFEIKTDQETEEEEGGLKLAFDTEGEPTEIGEASSNRDNSSRQKAMTELVTLLRDFFKKHPLYLRRAMWEKLTTGKGKHYMERLITHPKEQPLSVFKALVND